MTRNDLIHLVVLAMIAMLAVAVSGSYAFVLVPLLTMAYLGAVWRACRYRTEAIFVCLYSAYLALMSMLVASMTLPSPGTEHLWVASGPNVSSSPEKSSISDGARAMVPILGLAPPLMALFVLAWLLVGSIVNPSGTVAAKERRASWSVWSGYALVAILLGPVVVCGFAATFRWLLW